MDSESRDIDERDMGLSEKESDREELDDVSVQQSVSSKSLLSRLALISSFRIRATVIAVSSRTCRISLQMDTLGMSSVDGWI